MSIKTKAELIDYLNHGNVVEYLLFWGHQEAKGKVSKSCFSQWYEAPFSIDGITYRTAEHFMMAKKAELFGDMKSLSMILASTSPADAKKLGRNVAGFNESEWLARRFDIVVSTNSAKFAQNEALKEFLFSTREKVLVEASPVDKIWGIGLAADDPRASDPYKWQGLNLLGFALMQVREELKAQNCA